MKASCVEVKKGYPDAALSILDLRNITNQVSLLQFQTKCQPQNRE